jgi:hypothetical protein
MQATKKGREAERSDPIDQIVNVEPGRWAASFENVLKWALRSPGSQVTLCPFVRQNRW